MPANDTGVPGDTQLQDGAANKLASPPESLDAPTGSLEVPAHGATGSLPAMSAGVGSDGSDGQAGQGCAQAAQAARPGQHGAKHAVKAGPISKQDLERALQLVTCAAGL